MIQKVKLKVINYKNFVVKNFKHISAFLFVFGFVLDYLTLPNVTNIVSIFIGGTLMIIIGSLIYFRELLETDKLDFKNESKYVSYLSLIIAFLLGSFTSFNFVYYVRGGDIISNIPILILILGLMLSNEFVKNKYRLYVDLIAYSLATIFYFIFAVPYIFKTINNVTFIFSIIISFAILYFYLGEIYKLNIDIIKIKIHNYIFAPLLLICLFYFTNIFPAVPLNLSYANLYKNIKVQNTQNINNTNSNKKEYILEGGISRDIFNIIKNKSFQSIVYKSEYDSNGLYFYAELEAPSELNAKVTHRWEYFNQNTNAWEIRNEISYNIYGGRAGGYRGYSKINNLSLGEYRIKVLIDNKRLAGQIKFEIR